MDLNGNIFFISKDLFGVFFPYHKTLKKKRGRTQHKN